MVVVIAAALVFAYINGFHDASNAVATSVHTRALTPRIALLLAAVLNVVGALLGEGVARTIGSGIVDLGGVTATHGLVVVLSALVGAAAWSLLTWWRGLPSSSTHALIGGLAGAGLAAAVTVRWDVIALLVLLPMVMVPLVSAAAAYLLVVGLLWAFRNSVPSRTNRAFQLAQTISAAAMSLGHGLQDAQKTMGVIVLALVAGGHLEGSAIPAWVTVAAATALALGTYAGGWRIMRTLGRRVVEVDPPRGFAAESVATSVMYTTALAFAAPISTTHALASAVVGAGATRRRSAVRWGVARDIATAWVLTVPASAALAAGAYAVGRLAL